MGLVFCKWNSCFTELAVKTQACDSSWVVFNRLTGLSGSRWKTDAGNTKSITVRGFELWFVIAVKL